jgi:hypothetical protein
LHQEPFAEEISCAEDSEDPFRTARGLIRNKSCEACWSAFSARLGSLYCPNRDFICEGFSAFINSRNFKILDAYAIGLVDAAGNAVEIFPKSVLVTPWDVKYSYSFSAKPGAGALDVSYSLSQSSRHPSLVAHFYIGSAKEAADNLRIIVRPLVSLSPSCSADCAREISVAATQEKSLLCASQEACVEFSSRQAARATPLDMVQQWECKLGFGERKKQGDALVARPERATSRIAGQIELAPAQQEAALFATAFAPQDKPKSDARAPASPHPADMSSIAAKFSQELEAAGRAWGAQAKRRLAWRLYGLAHSFDFEAGGVRGFDAGSMWFRQLWLRDAFETLHSNFDFLFCCEPGRVKSLVLSGLSMQDPSGIIPTRVGGAGDKASNGLDSTLLCMLCGCRYYELSADAEVARAVSHALNRFLSQASSKRHAAALDFGLLSCPANYSWMDSCYKLGAGKEEVLVPYRLPREWLGTTDEQKKAAAAARYLLVETNALWVALLRKASRLSIPKRNGVDWLYRLSQRNFYEVFSHGGFLAHIASAQDPFGVRDSSFCSASVAAYSLVPHLFCRAEFSHAFSLVQKNLVYRNNEAFGIPVRSGPGFADAFEGDGQYHGHVCWPRENPYLYKFFLLCNRRDLAQQLLKSSLEQEFSESAVGYCPELFALDAGKSPVPVKNPAQLWSQFADPYLDFFKEKTQ